MLGFIGVLLLLALTVDGAYWDSRRVKVNNWNPPLMNWMDIDWPYLNDTVDPRFRGVFNFAGSCVGALIKTWNGSAPLNRNAAAIGVTGGSCFAGAMVNVSAQTQTNPAFPVGFRLNQGVVTTLVFWRFNDKPNGAIGVNTTGVLLGAVRGTDLTVVQVNAPIGAMLDRGFQFYDIMDTDDNLYDYNNLTTVTINSVEPMPIKYFRVHTNGLFLSKGSVRIQENYIYNYEIIRTRYLNFQAQGSPIFVAKPGEAPRLLAMGYAQRRDESTGSRLDVLKPCLNLTSHTFSFGLPGCLLNYRYHYLDAYQVPLATPAQYIALMANYTPPVITEGPTPEWPELPLDTDLESDWRKSYGIYP